MRNPARSHLMLIVLVGIALLGAQHAVAQNYQVVYSFHGSSDGNNPQYGLTLDRGGNLYGVMTTGGAVHCALNGDCGYVFEFSHRTQGWVGSGRYDFQGYDGACPAGEVAIGSDGAIYGTTQYGGPEGGNCPSGYGPGVVYRVRPSSTPIGGWTETVLHAFSGGADGAFPTGPVVFDAKGNLYFTTLGGGLDDGGVVAELSPGTARWTEQVLHSFTGGTDGATPIGGVTLDRSGNIYGTTPTPSDGQVFQLTLSHGVWTKNVLHQFEGGSDGNSPNGELIFDPSGNPYGTTSGGGTYDSGTVFELSPSDGGWNYSVIYSFQGSVGCGPRAGVIMDATGNLYGTSICDGAYQQGSVFKLVPSGGAWTYTSLHDFTGGSDGGGPFDRLTLDVSGNLYGTAANGGLSGGECIYGGCGVIFEITP